MKVTIEVEGITYSAELEYAKTFDILIDLVVNLSKAVGYSEETINKRVKEEQ
jgi:hypothetical protein